MIQKIAAALVLAAALVGLTSSPAAAAETYITTYGKAASAAVQKAACKGVPAGPTAKLCKELAAHRAYRCDINHDGVIVRSSNGAVIVTTIRRSGEPASVWATSFATNIRVYEGCKIGRISG